ncbi:sigma-70 family RNA polymerase sigma factor [Nocardioides sp.]|uniref:sigma-70 family RNA polymerase sigma factor n=1 Tax=Nocardioides sp. TaxID=35761 RepID=UPI0035167512
MREAAEPDSYVYRILLNTRATDRRRRWHGEHPTEELPEPAGPAAPAGPADDLATRIATRDAVVAALRTLPRGQQEVLVLRYVADLTERATAEVLGIAVGTVKSRTARALAALDGVLDGVVEDAADPDHLTTVPGDDR